MSVVVNIDGRPAEHVDTYLEVLSKLGPVPNESDGRFDIWVEQAPRSVTRRSVWFNQSPYAAQQNWLRHDGAVYQSWSTPEGSEDCLLQGSSAIRVHCADQAPVDPIVLAAFLAQDFPLVDALMLARAYRGNGWPNDLIEYPVPIGGPASRVRFAQFPRKAGLYAVVPSSEWVQRLVEAGVPVVQLRHKHTDAPRTAEIRKAIDVATGTNSLLFINDDWQLAIEHGAYGVHLGQEDIDSADLNAMHRWGLRLGISTHGIYEMLRAHACKPSYMALGAIYPTATKEMPTHPQGLRRLEHYVRLMSPHYPLVAIGGINLSRIADIWATGVDCAAVLRAIVEVSDYRKATADLLATSSQAMCANGAA